MTKKKVYVPKYVLKDHKTIMKEVAIRQAARIMGKLVPDPTPTEVNPEWNGYEDFMKEQDNAS